MKIADSVVLSLFVNFTEMCNIGHAFWYRLKQNSISKTILIKLKRFQRTREYYLHNDDVRGYVLLLYSTTPVVVEINTFYIIRSFGSKEYTKKLKIADSVVWSFS